MPPTTAITRKSVNCVKDSASAAICITNSLVGAIINPKGTPAARDRSSGFSRWKVMSDTKNAAVLPVPVCACAMMSAPSRLWGKTLF